MKRIILCMFISLMFLYGSVLEDGSKAYSKGDYKVAAFNYKKACNDDKCRGLF